MIRTELSPCLNAEMEDVTIVLFLLDGAKVRPRLICVRWKIGSFCKDLHGRIPYQVPEL